MDSGDPITQAPGGADGGTPPGRGGQQRPVLALAVVGALALLAGGIVWGVMALRPKPPAWQPGSINNLVLQAGPAVTAEGNDYRAIATRGEDPAPLTAGEFAKLFPNGKGFGPLLVSADCAGAVTGQAVVRALRAAGCSQVLRLILTTTGTPGPDIGLIDIFNLASGAAVYQAALVFGEESPYGPGAIGQPPNAAPGGFILPWPGTAAAGVARAPGNTADVDSFGHFLVVLWTYGTGGDAGDSTGPGLSNGLFELTLSQFAQNRVGPRDTVS